MTVSTFPRSLRGKLGKSGSRDEDYSTCAIFKCPYNLWGRVLMWLLQFDRRKNLIRQFLIFSPTGVMTPQNRNVTPKLFSASKTFL